MTCNPIPERQDWFICSRKPIACPLCKTREVRPSMFGMPTAEAAHSGKWAIMGCTLEEPSPKWACVRCNYKIYYPPDCLERDW